MNWWLAVGLAAICGGMVNMFLRTNGVPWLGAWLIGIGVAVVYMIESTRIRSDEDK